MIIYPTQGKALEYAPFGLEIYKTCPHKCRYCYNVTKPTKDTDAKAYHAGAVPIKRNPEKLRDAAEEFSKEIQYYESVPEKYRVLLSFGSDPYPEDEREMDITRAALDVLVEFGIPFQTLTKNPQLALRDLDLHKKGNGRFASTILFLDERLRADWEPGAPSVASRLEAVKAAHDKGVFTWVSIEPVVNPNEALKLIATAQDYVDLWKVGKLNYLPEVDVIDWRQFAANVHDALCKTGRPFIIKRSLAAFLPAGKEWSRKLVGGILKKEF